MRLPRTRTMFAATAAASIMLMTAACGSDDSSDTTESSQTSSADTSSDSSDTEEPTGSYTAGTYEASGTYSNPGGQSSVGVSVTIDESGEITEVEVTPEANGTSLQYQEKFASGIADEVVGVNIDDLDVSKVSGSSLTSGGFNAAIEEIKSEAQA